MSCPQHALLPRAPGRCAVRKDSPAAGMVRRTDPAVPGDRPTGRRAMHLSSSHGQVLRHPSGQPAAARDRPGRRYRARGGVIAYPTDSCYALGCQLGNKDGIDQDQVDPPPRRPAPPHAGVPGLRPARPVRLRRQPGVPGHQGGDPGSYTFILPATKEVPRPCSTRGRRPRRRIRGHVVAQALLAELGEPLVSSTLLLPGQDEPMTQGWVIAEQLEHAVDAVIDSATAAPADNGDRLLRARARDRTPWSRRHVRFRMNLPGTTPDTPPPVRLLPAVVPAGTQKLGVDGPVTQDRRISIDLTLADTAHPRCSSYPRVSPSSERGGVG